MFVLVEIPDCRLFQILLRLSICLGQQSIGEKGLLLLRPGLLLSGDFLGDLGSSHSILLFLFPVFLQRLLSSLLLYVCVGVSAERRA